MKKRVALGLFLCCLSSLFSMDWPSPEGTVTRNFGWNDRGQPVLGVSFESQGPIRAADPGELLFRHDQNSSASRLSSPLGSWVALDHGGGIVGLYSRMAESPEIPIPGEVEKNSLLGRAGISGWSDKPGVYFSLFDRKERRWINPVMIVTPPPDSPPPPILSVRLRDAQGRLFNPAEAGSVSQGRYAILVEAAAIPGSLAPFRIIGSANGLEIGRLNFETYSARDGSLMVYRNGLVPVRQIYAPHPAYELGEFGFSRGQVTLEIITQNAVGSSRNALFRVMVE